MNQKAPSIQRILLALHDAHIKPDAARKAIEAGMALAKIERASMTPRQRILAKAGLPPTAELFHETAMRKGILPDSRERYWEGNISDRDRTRLIKATKLPIEEIDAMDARDAMDATHPVVKATELSEADMEKAIKLLLKKAGFTSKNTR